MDGYPPKLEFESWQTVQLLCATAKKGLADCYCKTGWLKNNSLFNGKLPCLSMALNLRYVIIAQIGIRHWLRFHSDDKQLPDFWKYIHSRSNQINSAGDLGLAIWAGVESSEDNCKVFVERLVNNWSKLCQSCNAVELAWVVQGMVRFLQSYSMTGEMTDLLRDAYYKLMNLYCRDTGLFARHSQRGFVKSISRQVACFADQVYPILALTSYAGFFHDDNSIDVALAVADKLCSLQGPRGQWWWHYDVKTAAVVEEYPVFSVHQDAMAPMSLLAVDRISGADHSANIEKGLTWLNNNELDAVMLVPEQGIIWRDIHRREIGKIYRMTRSVLIASGLHSAHRLAGTNLFGYLVNRECRPYHLGWILYAWAPYLQKPNALPDNPLSDIKQ